MASLAKLNGFLLITFVIEALIVICHACTNGKIYDNTVTNKDIQDVVNTHNMYRSIVALGQVQNQPPAENMRKMKWDSKLAQTAQNWADRCEFNHDYSILGKQGQNLYIKYYGGSHKNRKHNFTAAIESWFNEHVYYRYKKLEKGDSDNHETQTGHYTQVVWADTYSVGCGFASYYQTQNKRDEILYVCNYAPPGNYRGEYPYKKGQPNCKANGLSNSNIKGLCS